MTDMIFAWDLLSLDQQLVGLVKNNPEMLHKLLEANVDVDYFEDEFAAEVYRTMLLAKQSDMPINDRNLISLMGIKYHSQWLDFDLNAPITANLEFFLEPFLEQHAARVVERNNAINKHLGPMELQRLNSSMVEDIMSGLQQQRNLQDISKDWGKRTDEFLAGQVVYLPTHIKELNHCIDGWRPGGLYIVGARPKVGKTTLALNFAHHLAVNHQARVIYASIEQSDVEIFDKFVSLQARVPIWKIKKRQITEGEIDRLHKARKELAQTRLDIWSNWQGRWDIVEPKLISAMKEKNKPQFIVLDHLHIMKPDSKTPVSSIEAITRLTGDAKVFAQTHNVPVLMCSQFNRESDKDERMPRLSDLRGSGSIEQDADVVMFVHRSNAREESRELLVAANRHGNTARIRLAGDLAISELKGEEF